jgi:protein gp37
VVECQKPKHPERAQFFQVALTLDGKQWSGETFMDETHLTDPLAWRSAGIVATGFHGDIGRLDPVDLHAVFAIVALCQMFRAVYPSQFLLLTKCPERLLEYLEGDRDLDQDWGIAAGNLLDGDWIWHAGKCHRKRIEAFISASLGFSPDGEEMLEDNGWPFPLENVSIGCSVMNQAGADQCRKPMAALAALGWSTHVWYEPALGSVNWGGWEFLKGLISGGESGAQSRPSKAESHRRAQMWCAAHGIPYTFKQWGEYLPPGQVGAPGKGPDGCQVSTPAHFPHPIRFEKSVAGALLDGREWKEFP